MRTASFFCLLLGVTAVATEPTVLLHEDFSSTPETTWGELPSGWWLEGAARGTKARIHEGRLWVDANDPKSPGATVWFDRIFSGDIEVSFDVQVVAAQAQANNMNLFFLFYDPANPDLRATASERADGRYALYHSQRLRGTILTFLADEKNHDEARVRVRQVPPFEPVLQEFTGYHARAGQTYHVVMSRRGSHLTCVIDGQSVIDVEAAKPEEATLPGCIGFRTWRTELWWDNLVVRGPAAVPVNGVP